MGCSDLSLEPSCLCAGSTGRWQDTAGWGSKQKLVRCPQPFWGWQGLRVSEGRGGGSQGEEYQPPPGLGQAQPFYSHD